MKFSIITVCFNAQSTIGDTVRSVAAQDWPDLEHIIIDGASTDETLSVVERYCHPRLRVLSEPDRGIYDAMNKGLRLATGDYVAFLNADDFYARNDAVGVMAERANVTNADLILGNTQFVSQSDTSKLGRHYSSMKFAAWWIKLGMMPPHPSMFARRYLIEQAGGFDATYKITADFDLVARLVLRHSATWSSVNITTTYFRDGGLSTQGGLFRPAISKEMNESLKALGVRGASWRTMLRYPIKLLQFLPDRATGSGPS